MSTTAKPKPQVNTTKEQLRKLVQEQKDKKYSICKTEFFKKVEGLSR